jgi:hypothetical protein
MKNIKINLNSFETLKIKEQKVKIINIKLYKIKLAILN